MAADTKKSQAEDTKVSSFDNKAVSYIHVRLTDYVINKKKITDQNRMFKRRDYVHIYMSIYQFQHVCLPHVVVFFVINQPYFVHWLIATRKVAWMDKEEEELFFKQSMVA